MWIFHCIISQDTCRIFKVQHSFGEKSAADLSPRHGLGLALFFAYRLVAFFGAPFRINLLYSFDLTG